MAFIFMLVVTFTRRLNLETISLRDRISALSATCYLYKVIVGYIIHNCDGFLVLSSLQEILNSLLPRLKIGGIPELSIH